jgi:AGZA family xanthine/uracil permease-like MFS transporter
VCNDTVDPVCRNNDAYAICVLEAERDLITATSAISAFASFFMGVLANLPVGMAPAMGLNAYLAYQVVGFHGTGPITYRVAMTSVFVEGLIFTALSLLGIRQWLNRIIPASIKMACGGGIGLFLALLGLSYSQGLGAITGAQHTPLELGGCPAHLLDPIQGTCRSDKASSPTMWLGFLAGGVLTAILITHRVRGAMIIGILVVSICSWPRNTSLTYFPHTAEGDSRFDYFTNVVEVPSIRKTLLIQDWDLSNEGWHFALAVFTMLYVDILNATGSLYSMARFTGIVDPDTGDFPRSTLAYATDSVSIVLGSLLGLSPVTVFVESGVSTLFHCHSTLVLTHPDGHCGRWPHRPSSMRDGLLLRSLPLLRSHFCVDSAVGYWRYPHSGRMHDDARCDGD